MSAVRRLAGLLEVRVFNPTEGTVTVRVGSRSGWLVDLRGRTLEALRRVIRTRSFRHRHLPLERRLTLSFRPSGLAAPDRRIGADAVGKESFAPLPEIVELVEDFGESLPAS